MEINRHKVFLYCSDLEFVYGQKTIVFVHGAACDHSIWKVYADRLVKQQLNIMALDLPGHGESQGTPLTSVEDMADWLLEVLAAAPGDGNEFVLVGHSLGSLICLEAAARNKLNKLERVVLMGTAVPMQVAPALLEAANDNQESVIDTLVTYGHSYCAGGGDDYSVYPQGFHDCMNLMKSAASGVSYADLNACNEYKNGLAACQKLRCPAVIIAAEKDMLTPKEAALRMLDVLPEGRLIEVQGSGHMMFSEQPEASYEALIGAIG